ncbi:MAG: hypothetical protein EPO12_18000, partial [Aquabacterium sp.]
MDDLWARSYSRCRHPPAPADKVVGGNAAYRFLRLLCRTSHMCFMATAVPSPARATPANARCMQSARRPHADTHRACGLPPWSIDDLPTRTRMEAAVTDQDIYLLREGTHARLYEILGAHPRPGGRVRFAVWAPNAQAVSVIGEWNHWRPHVDQLQSRWDGSGIWEGESEHAQRGQCYKFHIESRGGQAVPDK